MGCVAIMTHIYFGYVWGTISADLAATLWVGVNCVHFTEARTSFDYGPFGAELRITPLFVDRFVWNFVGRCVRGVLH